MFRFLLLLGLAIPAIGFLAKMEDEAAARGRAIYDTPTTATTREEMTRVPHGGRPSVGVAPRARSRTDLARKKELRDRAYANYVAASRRFGPNHAYTRRMLENYRRADQAFRYGR